jgi:hypothetical protein
MRLALDRGTAAVIVGAVVPPLAFVVTGRSSAPTLLSVASLLAITAGLAVLERELRGAGLAAVSVATSLFILYGTGLLWHEVVEPGRTALTFVAGTLLFRAWGDRPGTRRADAIARGGALGVALAACALLTEAAAGPAPSLARPSLLDSLFSSRHGLFFWAPALTVAVIGLGLRA